MTVVAAGVAGVLLPHGPDVADTNQPTSPAVQVRLETPSGPRLQAVMERYGCRNDGFGDRQIPRSAIIRNPRGRISVVSFDRGWKVFENDGGDRLVAVCLRPAR